MSRCVEVELLTAAGFVPFGRVIEADQRTSLLINDGHTRRFDALAAADCGADGEAVLSIFRGTRRPDPFRIAMLERHPLGAQAFVPMERQPWLAPMQDFLVVDRRGPGDNLEERRFPAEDAVTV